MIRAALVGLGWWGRLMVEQTSLRGTDLRFTHAVARDPNASSDFARLHELTLLTSLSAALADEQVDAIVLATPNSQHVDQIVACASAGKSVYSEKPLGLTLGDARRAVAACEDAGVILGLGTDRRLLPAMRQLAGMAGDGFFGSPLQLEAQYSNDNMRRGVSGAWRASVRETPGGGMTGPGLHALDSLVSLGGQVARLSGQLLHPLSGSPFVDAAAIVGQFASGAGFTLGCVRGTPDYFRVAYFGESGWGEVRDHGSLQYRRGDGALHSQEHDPTLAVAALLDAFARSVEHGEPFPVSTRSMLDTAAAFDAAIAAMNAPGTMIEVAPA